MRSHTPARCQSRRRRQHVIPELTPRSLREVEAEAVALVCLEALQLPGADHSRGYIQSWNARRGAEPIPERSAQRIFKAADQILRAGRDESEARS
ncbi:unnamed protein product [uncultured bacterium]|nr:unnamed protein product [uncultured bacterium]